MPGRADKIKICNNNANAAHTLTLSVTQLMISCSYSREQCCGFMVMSTFGSVEERTMNYETGTRELGGFLCESKILKKPFKTLFKCSPQRPNAFATAVKQSKILKCRSIRDLSGL